MIHVFTTKGQPLTRFDLSGPVGGDPMWVIYPPLQRFTCDICWRKRAAKNLSIQVYYDMHRIFCTERCEPISYKEKRRIWAQETYREKKSQASEDCEHKRG